MHISPPLPASVTITGWEWALATPTRFTLVRKRTRTIADSRERMSSHIVPASQPAYPTSGEVDIRQRLVAHKAYVF